MDRQSLADACWVEHKILEHVKAALRLTLDWNVPAVGLNKTQGRPFLVSEIEDRIAEMLRK